MPIDSEFPKNHKVIGKHKNEDGRFHFVWGPGRSDAESSSHEQVQEAYKTRGEEYVPLGVHGTFVGVDWDSCIADGACIEACPVERGVYRGCHKYSSGTEVNMIYPQ